MQPADITKNPLFNVYSSDELRPVHPGMTEEEYRKRCTESIQKMIQKDIDMLKVLADK